jgi:hypothetical protein
MRRSSSNSSDSDIEHALAGDLRAAYWRERATREQLLLRGRAWELWTPGSEPPTDYAAKDGNFRLRNGMICARMLYSGLLSCMHTCLRGRLPFTAKRRKRMVCKHVCVCARGRARACV